MNTVWQNMLTAGAAALRNRNYDVCGRWATARRTMQDGCQYSLDHYPYVEGILNSRAKKNWVMKAAQVGLTEAGITIAMFEADFHHRDVIYYFPTKRMGERFSKTRFFPAIMLSPYLRERCTNNSVEIKQFGVATIHILGANSMADLKGTSSGRLLFDELDEWTEQQIYLAEERASGQKNDDTIIWGFSTPKYPNLGIHKQYLHSTREHFRFDCPHCHQRIELMWEDRGGGDFGSFMLHGSAVDDSLVHGSYLKCFLCEGRLEHKDKLDWLKPKTRGGSAEWEATNLEADPNVARGFYLSQLYSPTVAPYQIAIAYLRGHGDEAARREFHNSKLGQPYIEDCYQINDQQIDVAIHEGGTYSFNSVSTESLDDCYVTLGVDPGGPIHHWVAVDWKFDLEKLGDPNDRAEGKVIGCGRILADDWDQIHELMRRYLVRMCVIDAQPSPTLPRVFARAFNGYVYLNYYVVGKSGRELSLSEDDYGANTVKVDKVGWLSKTLGRFTNRTMKLPLDVPLEFRQQIKAPVRTMKKGEGQQYIAEFVETGPDHFAHALNYAEIALKILDPALHTDNDIIRTA